MEKILVSACLLNQPVRYDGTGAGCHALLQRWWAEGRIVMVCPEVSGGGACAGAWGPCGWWGGGAGGGGPGAGGGLPPAGPRGETPGGRGGAGGGGGGPVGDARRGAPRPPGDLGGRPRSRQPAADQTG